MTISEIRKTEEQRKDLRQQKTVHLLREGEWYRAHDHSAWLLARFPMGEASEKPLKVIAKRLKDGYVDAFCGFPCSSMGKYLPNDGTIDFLPVNDAQIDVVLNQVELDDATEEQLREEVDKWKDSLPASEGRKQRREDRDMKEQLPRITRISDIFGRILAIPMEDISPREAYSLLRDLRRDVAAIF